ncbi:MAG: hypothetical protein JWM41_2170 [Gemmatimonadetes bacterium]|nr:hypothetical protein [Gemmatimonadota bacterium]
MADKNDNAGDLPGAQPVNANGPLPLTLANLQFVPKEKHQQYAQQMDGSFTLAYIHVTDGASLSAHQELVATAKLRVLPEGATPKSLDDERSARDRQAAEILQLADNMSDQARMTRQQALEPEYQRELAKLNQKYLR